MKKIIAFMGGALFCLLACAQNFGVFRVEDNALYTGKKQFIDFQFIKKNWMGTATEVRKLEVANGYPKIEKGKYFETKGFLAIQDNPSGEFYEKFTFVDKNTCNYTVRFSPPKDYEYASLHLSISLPFDQFRDSITIDSKKVEFPKVDNSFSIYKNAYEICYAGADGISKLKLDNAKILLQDNRRFKIETASLRIPLVKQEDGSFALTFTISYFPHKMDTINIDKQSHSKLEAGNLPRGNMQLGHLYYKIPESDSCIEIAAGQEVEILLKGNGANIIYLLNAFESKDSLTGDLAEITPIGEGVGAPVKLAADISNSFSDDKSYSVWRSKPAGMGVRKLYSSKLNLGSGKIKSVKLKNLTDSAWKIAAITTSTADLSKELTYCKYVAEDENYAPFDFGVDVEAGSVLDMSGLLDAPAGKYGFVKTYGSRIAFENKPDADLKLMGTNFCMNTNYPTHENAERLADIIARTGYNTVRFHHFDWYIADQKSKGGTGLKADYMDKIDYLFAALKKRGIYITIDLYISRGIEKGVLEPEFEEAVYEKGADTPSRASAEMKAMFNLSENAKKNWEEFSANLLNHVNPYTSLAWKDDPALVSISLVNENTIGGTVNKKTRPFYMREYNKWLAKNNISETEENKTFLFRKFLHQLYMQTYNRMHDFVKSLGVKALLTDQNHWSGFGVGLEGENYEIFDTHYYFGHPHFLEKSWSLPARLRNDSSIGAKSNGLGKGSQMVKDRPFYITEWNHVLNNESAAEGAFLWGAYSALQDWTGYYRFAYSHGVVDFKPHGVGFFDSNSNPIAFLSDRAAAMFLLRGDVKKSRLVIPYLIARDILDRPDSNTARQLTVTPQILEDLAYVGRTESTFYDKISDVDLGQGAKFAVATEQGWIDAMKDKKVFRAWDYTDEYAQEVFKKLNCDVANGVFKSSTGQLTLDRNNRTFTAKTPKSEAFVGDEGAKLKGDFARVNCSKSYSAILVASADNKILESSSRLLILHLSSLKNTNMKFTDDTQTILLGWGTRPMLARASSATLTLYRDFTGFKLYAVSPEGKRIAEVPMKIDAEKGKTVIKMNTVSDNMVVFVYELVKE